MMNCPFLPLPIPINPDSAQFTFREEWWDPRLAYGRFADDETEVPLFVVLATSEQADLSQQIWVGLAGKMMEMRFRIIAHSRCRTRSSKTKSRFLEIRRWKNPKM